MDKYRSIEIAGRRIGHGDKPYVIAEMSGNHNGDPARAARILDAAKAAGVDAVKLQTFNNKFQPGSQTGVK
jgi:N-acetylneuraminate synthase